jgi:hypothetical protein
MRRRSGVAVAIHCSELQGNGEHGNNPPKSYKTIHAQTLPSTRFSPLHPSPIPYADTMNRPDWTWTAPEFAGFNIEQSVQTTWTVPRDSVRTTWNVPDPIRNYISKLKNDGIHEEKREKNQNLDVDDVAEETRDLNVSLTMLFSSKFCGNMSWC